MLIEKCSAIYFSPNKTGKKAAQAIASGVFESFTDCDLTDFDTRWERRAFSEKDLAVIVLPVYGGRLPGICREFFRGLSGHNTPAIISVVYGNIQLGDALYELKQAATKAGFKVVAAAAIPAEHCMNKQVATGRPNAEDVDNLKSFGQRVLAKISASDFDVDKVDLSVPGCYPYKYAVHDRPISPATKEGAEKNSFCAKHCPVRCINPNDHREVDAFRCIFCMKCVNSCKNGEKYINNEAVLSRIEYIGVAGQNHKQQQLFV